MAPIMADAGELSRDLGRARGGSRASSAPTGDGEIMRRIRERRMRMRKRSDHELAFCAASGGGAQPLSTAKSTSSSARNGASENSRRRHRRRQERRGVESRATATPTSSTRCRSALRLFQSGSLGKQFTAAVVMLQSRTAAGADRQRDEVFPDSAAAWAPSRSSIC